MLIVYLDETTTTHQGAGKCVKVLATHLDAMSVRPGISTVEGENPLPRAAL